jgi:ABC-type glycerol-3-phosphate transport system substrate-binding protein
VSSLRQLRVTRRGLVVATSASLAGLLLAACGSPSTPSSSSAPAAPTTAPAAPTSAAAPAPTSAPAAAPTSAPAAPTTAPAAAPTTAPAAAAASTGAKVDIKWLEWWVHEWGPDNHAKLISGFEQANPNISVTVVDVSYPQMSQKLTAAAAAGDTSYDAFGTEGSWIPNLAKLGYVADLTPILKSDATFFKSLTTATPWNYLGKTMGLALYLIPFQFAYNQDIFAKKNLQPPTNWDEFLKVEQTLRDKASNSYGMSMPLKDGGFTISRYFAFRLAQFGGQLFDSSGNVVFNSPEGVATLDWWKKFYGMDLVVPDAMGEDQTQMLEYVATQKVPTIIDGPFIWTKAKQMTPSIKLAYAPAWKDKTGGYAWASSGMGLSSKSTHPDQAATFLKYLYSDQVSVTMTKVVSLPWATNAGMASLKGSDDPILRYIPDFANQDPAHNVNALTIVPDGTTLIASFLLAFQDVMTGKQDSKAAIDAVAAKWQKTIDAAR